MWFMLTSMYRPAEGKIKQKIYKTNMIIKYTLTSYSSSRLSRHQICTISLAKLYRHYQTLYSPSCNSIHTNTHKLEKQTLTSIIVYNF